MLFIVMHNVIIFLLVNPPLSACERRSCRSRLSDWLHTGSIQFDKSGRKRQWRRHANGKTLEQNASIGSVRSGYPVEGAAALGFRARILRSSSGMKRCGFRLIIVLGKRTVPMCNRAIDGLMFS